MYVNNLPVLLLKSSRHNNQQTVPGLITSKFDSIPINFAAINKTALAIAEGV